MLGRREQGSPVEIVELRLASSADAAALRRVAGRDTKALPPAPHLVAVRDGRIDAVLSVTTLEVVADPFRPTAELVELLRVRARTISAPPGGRRAATPRPRPRPVTA